VLIDLNPDGGGVLIVGTWDELDDLRGTLADAMEDGEGVGQVLTNEAVETLTIRKAVDDA
jgi:hypothetical protein